jgi:hypothetical protein
MTPLNIAPPTVADYTQLPEEKKAVLDSWVKTALKPARRATSHGLRNDFEKTPEGFHISNGHLLGAMLAAGYKFKNVLRAQNTSAKSKPKT